MAVAVGGGVKVGVAVGGGVGVSVGSGTGVGVGGAARGVAVAVAAGDAVGVTLGVALGVGVPSPCRDHQHQARQAGGVPVAWLTWPGVGVTVSSPVRRPRSPAP